MLEQELRSIKGDYPSASRPSGMWNRARRAVEGFFFPAQNTAIGYPKGQQPETSGREIVSTTPTTRIPAPREIAIGTGDITFQLPKHILDLYGKRGPLRILKAFEEIAGAQVMQKSLPPAGTQDLIDSRDLYVAELMNQYTFPLLDNAPTQVVPALETSDQQAIILRPTRIFRTEEENQLLLERYRDMRAVYNASKTSIDSLINENNSQPAPSPALSPEELAPRLSRQLARIESTGAGDAGTIIFRYRNQR